MTRHQYSKVTQYNRYPEIFSNVSEYVNSNFKRPNVLSFGCSDGSEIKTLHELYIKDGHFTGCDFELITGYDFIHADNLPYYSGKFDCIFAMSVLCRYSEVEKLEYNFSEFEHAVLMLHNLLNVGGVLVIYNSNYCLKDTKVYQKYKPMDGLKHGFVPQRNKNGSETICDEIAFIKIAE